MYWIEVFWGWLSVVIIIKFNCVSVYFIVLMKLIWFELGFLVIVVVLFKGFVGVGIVWIKYNSWFCVYKVIMGCGSFRV